MEAGESRIGMMGVVKVVQRAVDLRDSQISLTSL